MTRSIIEQVKALYDDPDEPHPTEHAYKRILSLLESADEYLPVPVGHVAASEDGGIYIYFSLSARDTYRYTLIQTALGETKLWYRGWGEFRLISDVRELVAFFNHLVISENLHQKLLSLDKDILDLLPKPNG